MSGPAPSRSAAEACRGTLSRCKQCRAPSPPAPPAATTATAWCCPSRSETARPSSAPASCAPQSACAPPGLRRGAVLRVGGAVEQRGGSLHHAPLPLLLHAGLRQRVRSGGYFTAERLRRSGQAALPTMRSMCEWPLSCRRVEQRYCTLPAVSGAVGRRVCCPAPLSCRYVKNTSNTNVVHWGGRLWTLFEAGQPYRLDPQSLDTQARGGGRGRTAQRSCRGPAWHARFCYWMPQPRQPGPLSLHPLPCRSPLRRVWRRWGASCGRACPWTWAPPPPTPPSHA